MQIAELQNSAEKAAGERAAAQREQTQRIARLKEQLAQKEKLAESLEVRIRVHTVAFFLLLLSVLSTWITSTFIILVKSGNFVLTRVQAARDAARQQLEALVSPVEDLFSQIGCERASLGDTLGNDHVTRGNLELYLAVIEQACLCVLLIR